MNFGNSEKYDSVIINHNLSPKTRIGLTKEIWKPFLHYEKGYCYTFDPKKYNFSQNSVVYKGENLLRIKMNLDVSFQRHIFQNDIRTSTHAYPYFKYNQRELICINPKSQI